jgi:ECF sigma factor
MPGSKWLRAKLEELLGGLRGAHVARCSFAAKMLADGKQEAAGELIPVVYRELHRLAVVHLRQERPNHTLQATALVNEAYIKLGSATGYRLEEQSPFL